jgi:hypothetical protein
VVELVRRNAEFAAGEFQDGASRSASGLMVG